MSAITKMKLLLMVLFSVMLISVKVTSHECQETWEDIRSMIVEGASSTLVEKGKAKDTYAPWKVIDGDPGTAWVEGKGDEGIDEFLVFGYGFEAMRFIEILPGFARNDNLFKANNRPKDIVIMLVKLDSGMEIRKIDDLKNDKVKVIKEYSLRLDDERKYQRFMLKGFEEVIDSYYNGKVFGTRLNLLLFIKSVYRGSKDNDTCFSEIKFIHLRDSTDIIKEYRDNKRWKKWNLENLVS